ncbi:MAG: amidase domain-containing protein [Clostridia bacterium]|nr:amidase domain-containing protein [Clostridia bacterium]
MLIPISYNRSRAVEYARRWALSRNPLFSDFAGFGGDCTNFVSQCILAGCGVMNFTPTFGWYYINPENRAPAWSGVDELYRFLLRTPDFLQANGGIGPYATDARAERQVAVGDVIQLANDQGEFYHTLIISEITPDDVLVCAHTNDALDRPLSEYSYASLRVLHLEGAILLLNDEAAYEALLSGSSLETLLGPV